MRLISFVYNATPKIFRIILSALFAWQKIVRLASTKPSTKQMLMFQSLSNRKWPSLVKCHLDETCDKKVPYSKKIIQKQIRNTCVLRMCIAKKKIKIRIEKLSNKLKNVTSKIENAKIKIGKIWNKFKNLSRFFFGFRFYISFWILTLSFPNLIFIF